MSEPDRYDALSAPRAGSAAEDRLQDKSHSRRRLERYAWLLDSSLRLPGGFRIGVDGLIGLVPGIGDAAGALLSSYIIAEAVRMKAPRWVILRMALNVALETVVGAIPVLGDLFDFVYKANQKNVALLQDYEAHPESARSAGRKSVLFAAAVGACMLGLVLFLVILLLRGIVSLF